MVEIAAQPPIVSPAGLSELVEHLRAQRRFAFDTEFVSEETFEPVLCLIQVATRDRLAVIDPLAVRDLTDLIAARVAEWGRADWVETELTEFAAAILARSGEDRWRRLSGLNQLNRRGLEVARRLAEWRQAEARRTNRPLRQLLRDDLL